ncbi:MAG TPA: RecX family transcriptional regulator, partial [Solirubrobacteraceae bacterium]|nr:RecX family transcriptional regulator [Solirubrobacteraceae bacterium]
MKRYHLTTFGCQMNEHDSERIERRLTALGVEPELIAAALSDGDSGELEAAVALLQRRFPTVPADERERARALGLLLRKGYELELAHDAIRAQTN